VPRTGNNNNKQQTTKTKHKHKSTNKKQNKNKTKQTKQQKTTNNKNLAQPLLRLNRHLAQRESNPAKSKTRATSGAPTANKKQMRGSTAIRALPERGIPNHTSGEAGEEDTKPYLPPVA
jgi:hypothetical protein